MAISMSRPSGHVDAALIGHRLAAMEMIHIAKINVVNITSMLLLTVDDQDHASMLRNASTALTVTVRLPT